MCCCIAAKRVSGISLELNVTCLAVAETEEPRPRSDEWEELQEETILSLLKEELRVTPNTLPTEFSLEKEESVGRKGKRMTTSFSR